MQVSGEITLCEESRTKTRPSSGTPLEAKFHVRNLLNYIGARYSPTLRATATTTDLTSAVTVWCMPQEVIAYANATSIPNKWLVTFAYDQHE